jgi:glucosylceramidase
MFAPRTDVRPALLRWLPGLSLLAALASGAHARAAIVPPAALVPFGARRAGFVQSSAAGDRFRALPAVALVRGAPPARAGVTVVVRPERVRQQIVGVGGALTEASTFVLAGLPRATRDSVLDLFFGPTGADFTMARTPIGSCDFSVEGNFSYADVADDTSLAHFSLERDRRGLPGARDPDYSLLSLLRDAHTRQPGLAIVASAWSAPPWMKDNRRFYEKGVRGGRLLPKHYATFADYLAKYVEARRAEGIPIWALTPVNEPLGVGGQWESTEFTAAEMRDFVCGSLGPRLNGTGVRILQYDQNRDANALEFARELLGDRTCAEFVWGTALHWYSSTNSACTPVLDTLRSRYPDKPLVHTEGCIDGIGTVENSPNGRFPGWRNDAWWWREEATDWGWKWAPAAEKAAHPRYAPVHRYARDLIDGLNHGLAGWIDWNIALDQVGGPNHENNRCAAPVMIDAGSGAVYRTPLLDVIAHFSRYVRPGDHVVETTVAAPGLGADEFRAVATVSADGRTLVVIAFNRGAAPAPYALRVGERGANVTIPANAIQTLSFALD